MKHSRFVRLMALLITLCLLPTAALAYGEVPVFQDPVTHTDMQLNFRLLPTAFPEDTAADLNGWQEFLEKISFRGSMDLQNPLTEKVRAWFDGGLYVKDKLIVPFQVDVYFAFRYFISQAIKGESMFFKMENFFEFMMKPRYFMDLPTDYISLLMYPEAALEMRDRFYTPLAELCKGQGDRVIPYDDLYDLCLSWEKMYENDWEDDNKLYFFLTVLLYQLGINYDVYDKIGEMTAWLDMLDPEAAGMTITEKDGIATYTIGEYVVFTTDVNSTRNFTLSLPDENGNLLTFTSKDAIQDDWDGDYWWLDLAITLAPEEEGGERENYLTLGVDCSNVPLRPLFITGGVITINGEGTALQEPFQADFHLYMNRTDCKLPNVTEFNLHYLHPETSEVCFVADLILSNSEVPFTVLQERDYPQEDLFHLNDEYLQRIKESYIPSLAVSFLPVIAEMPAGVINDVIRFAEETGILVSLGIE